MRFIIALRTYNFKLSYEFCFHANNTGFIIKMCALDEIKVYNSDKSPEEDFNGFEAITVKENNVWLSLREIVVSLIYPNFSHAYVRKYVRIRSQKKTGY